MLGGLTKLFLSSPGQLSGDILAALSRVRCLAYLKLIASQLDKLTIVQGALGSLQCLCIMVEVMTELEVQEGALPLLESLRLLCTDLNGFCSMTIQSLRRIKEVTLHDGVSDETKHEWKEAAKKHPRRPKLLFVKTVEDVDMGCEPTYNSKLMVMTCNRMMMRKKIDFASKTCLDPPMNKESFEQGMEGMVGLEDERMEDVTRSTDQNDVLLVVGENRRKRARLDIGEDNSMDKVVDRVKRKNPEDVQETRPTKQTAPGIAVVVSDGN
ncbi:unnamed protein product [Triticum turgidum subsp. durum]|uniref:Uncharacterized protein n=1 Tax=Triticum turgidum subsp. durum TaxID=4567 RepID=A0A9R0Z247_TRITD|nr:unnamed protein product [Triticum turgidum subsp. durum]